MAKKNDNIRDKSDHGPEYVRLLQGKATNDLTAAVAKTAAADRLGKTKIAGDDWALTFVGKVKSNMKVSGDAVKLLDMAAVKLAAINQFRPGVNQKIESTVEFSLADYGQLCGKNTIPKDDGFDERKRAKNAIDNFRRIVKKALDDLYSMSISWKEPFPIRVKDKTRKAKKAKRDFMDVRILQKKGIRNGKVIMQFTDDFAEYLLNAYAMNYPLLLLQADSRNPNAYPVGRKLALNYSMDKNQINDRADIIGVQALLKSAPGIMSFEEVQEKDPGHWKNRIMRPLERALDDNRKLGWLWSWCYCGAKKQELSDKEIEEALADYESWSKLYIRFEPINMPIDYGRITRNLKNRKKKAKAGKDNNEK